jgi:autotransporter-associated beta strand protein
MKEIVKLPLAACFCVLLFTASRLFANSPGGTNGSATPVTLVNNGNGNVTMANGIVSIVCQTSGAQINDINYTYNNSGSVTTLQLLSGGTQGGKLYWENGGFGSGTYTYTPVAAGPNYAEMDLLSTSTTNGVMDVHFSMLQGSPGFYVTAIWMHRSQDIAMSMGETRDNIYSGAIFNWMCVDAARNRLMEVTPGEPAVAVYGAPKEVSLWTGGIYQGRYEDKYKYSADFGSQRVWGWASVGAGGKNVGLWNILGSVEYYNGGPMKRELMSHIGTTILNMTRGGHYGGGSDTSWAAGEVWTHCYGPWFIYCNNVTNSLTNPAQAAANLYGDAQAQAAAEQSAWPYAWLTNAAYAPASNRGTVSGQIVIADAYNPNASAAGLWVGVVQQPSTTDGVYDFQDWAKPYQFWVKSDTNGNFTIPNVIATNNYTLYAFGPGAAGMFMSQHQTGGNPPLTYNLPATPFSVTVTGGGTNNLGIVTWTPTRVGPTVFEIGYPNRVANKFRHGDDWWVADIGPSANAPSPIWSKFLEYPFDFPNGVNYVVGQSRWATDWNFCQPAVYTTSGGSLTSTSTINFNLPSAPAGGAQASVYLADASDFSGPIVISVNGNNLGSASGVTSTPNAENANGYNPAYSGGNQGSDTTVREGIHGCYSDNRVTFPASLLRAGANTITVKMNSGSGDNHIMYDYFRLELAGYVPPAPASVTAYPGNNGNLLSWPATPGVTSYNILRSATSGSGYASIATGIVGPVCGSGTNNAVYLDTNVVNGQTYYYEVQSVNPVGVSADSPPSPGAAPSASAPATPPTAPTGLVATASHTNVALSWSASPGASYYCVWRNVLANTGGGTSNILGTIILNNTNTTTAYTDTTPTDGSYYSYFVTAANAAGTSPNSGAVNATPLPTPPASAPTGLTISKVDTTTNQQATLRWNTVPGAVGYILYRSTSPTGPFTFSGGYVMSLTETSYTDAAPLGAIYYYVVVAMNAGGVSANSAIVSTLPPPPGGLIAIPGNGQISLVWSAVSGATSYTVKRGTSSGNETTTVATGITSNYFINTGLVNGITYYYVVTASSPSGTSPNSAETNAIPTAAITNSIWSGASNTTWDTATTNWLNAGTSSTYSDGAYVTFNDTAVTPTVAIASTVYPAAVTFANATLNYTLSAGGGGISIFASVVKSNAANVTFTSANSYIGGTAINGGMITLNGANGSSAFTSALGSGPVTIGTGGELQFAPPGGSAGQTSSTFTNSFILNGGTLYGNDGQEHLTGGISVNAPSTLLRQWDNSTADQSKALLLDGVLSGSASLALSGVGGATSQGARIWIDNSNNSYGGTINVNANTALGGFALGLGANTALQYATVNLQGTRMAGSTDATLLYGLEFLSGQDAPVLGALQGNGNIALADLAGASANLTVGGNNANTTFSGVLSGAGNLIKTGLGNFALSGQNTYIGGTTISNGTLLISGAGSLGRGAYSGNITNYGAFTYNSGTSQTLSGIISGTGALIQNGSGTLTLSAVNTYSGNTVINAGTLSLTGSGSIANSANLVLASGATLNVAGTSGFTVSSGQYLSGRGTVNGSATINGILSPGDTSFGTLVFNNSLALAAASTNIFKISPAPLTNDAIRVLGTLTNGGTLVVTNIGLTPLAERQTFQLFTAANYTGTCSSVILPSLPVGLAWNTNLLNTAGVLSVVVATQPAFQMPRLSAGGLVFTGGGGVAGAACYLIDSTNLATPLSNWTILLTNLFDTNGNFNFTNPTDRAQPQLFYRLQIP